MKNITWSLRAAKQFNIAIEFIRRDSVQNAENVRVAILAKIDRIAEGKIVHRIDPYRTNNNGNYRYLVVHNYRISYCETEDEIIVIRVRHENMEPKNY